MPDYLLAIDQGTTSTRAIVFDAALAPVASAQQELRQIYPAPGLVEHDPEEIWSAALRPCARPWRAPARGQRYRGARHHQPARDHDRVGPRHQPPDPQCHRLAGSAHGRRCATLRAGRTRSPVAARTGLLLDPYFSATKIAWLLDNVEGARAAARRAGSPSARWTVSCSGGSPAERCTRAMRPMPRARCCWTSGTAAGTPSSAGCSTSPTRSCRRCAIAPATSAPTGSLRRRDPYFGNRRRPAGSDGRAGLL